MYTNRRQLKAESKAAMSGHSPNVFLVSLVFLLILYVLDWLSSRLIFPNWEMLLYAGTPEEMMQLYELLLDEISFPAWLLTLAMEIMAAMIATGFTSFCLSVSRGRPAGVQNLFDAFGLFFRALWLYVVMSVKIFLWSLLLFVPGMIAAYRYSMAIYILLDDPDKPALACIRESAEITRGYKMELFVLDLSFLGWTVLGMIPFVRVYTAPYMGVTKANYYRVLSGRFEEPLHIDFSI